MKKRFSLILWIICIAMYILNIVIICVNGASVINNILAWSYCIFLVISIILLQHRNEQLYNKLDCYEEILVFFLEKESADQTQQNTENKGGE